MSLNSGPSLAPSKAVTPRPVMITAAVPCDPSIRPAPTTGGRPYSAPSWRAIGASEPKRLK